MKTPETCLYCDNPKILAKQMCAAHYGRWRRGVDLNKPLQRRLVTDDLEERLRYYAPEGDPDECWLWTGALNKGYGSMSVSGSKKREAHIVAWEIANGRSAKGLIIRHSCDNPPCTNPSHLFDGTHADNVADKVEKGRQSAGEAHGNAKLTSDAVDEIRDLYATGAWTQQQLADLHGVSRPLVSLVVNRKVWFYME